MKFKIGIGYDIHRLVPGRKLVLGGITIEHSKGLLAHSDGDVLIHAISDAILGALALPNIGEAFPNSEAWTKDIDSKEILRYAKGKMINFNCEISNLDATIIAQEPQLARHITSMRSSLAEILDLETDSIGLKATSSEGLGEIGHGAAIAAIANVIIFSR
ncbi:MAG: 2-C-methyl-D-erythritol 2,4-cyclodiphosphate synthase [Puniceicoccales bacterium]|nr:2-C-methyl-D-erythritol 2,4-cyclodiphosphate synthase [Puniceicoccales bacterium]